MLKHLPFIGRIKRGEGVAACISLFVLIAFIALVVPWRAADAASFIRALDEPAIAVKAPDKAFLVAITNAGPRLVAVGEHGVIIYSDDNGASWRQASVPVMVTLTAVAFADPLNGWAVGHYGVILHTGDGGVTWQLQLNGIQANALTMAAAQAAAADGSTAAGAPYALKRAAAFLEAGPDKPFLCLQVTSANDVTVFGAYRMVMHTTDGGKHWSDWSLQVADNLSHNLYAVTAPGPVSYLVGEMGLIFRSTDAGQSYQEIQPPSSATFFGVITLNDNSIFVFGVAGLAFRSNDGGKTLQPIILGTSTNLVAGLHLKSGAIVLAAQDGRLFMSEDNATTFKSLQTVIPMGVSGIAEATDGDLVVAGDHGIVRIASANLY